MDESQGIPHWISQLPTAGAGSCLQVIPVPSGIGFFWKALPSVAGPGRGDLATKTCFFYEGFSLKVSLGLTPFTVGEISSHFCLIHPEWGFGGHNTYMIFAERILPFQSLKAHTHLYRTGKVPSFRVNCRLPLQKDGSLMLVLLEEYQASGMENLTRCQIRGANW